MEKLNRAQKCSILGPQNLGSRGGPPWIRTWFNNWWLVRVTFVAAFGFFPNILGGGDGTLSIHECRFTSGDAMSWR